MTIWRTCKKCGKGYNWLIGSERINRIGFDIKKFDINKTLMKKVINRSRFHTRAGRYV